MIGTEGAIIRKESQSATAFAGRGKILSQAPSSVEIEYDAPDGSRRSGWFVFEPDNRFHLKQHGMSPELALYFHPDVPGESA